MKTLNVALILLILLTFTKISLAYPAETPVTNAENLEERHGKMARLIGKNQETPLPPSLRGFSEKANKLLAGINSHMPSTMILKGPDNIEAEFNDKFDISFTLNKNGKITSLYIDAESTGDKSKDDILFKEALFIAATQGGYEQKNIKTLESKFLSTLKRVMAEKKELNKDPVESYRDVEESFILKGYEYTFIAKGLRFEVDVNPVEKSK